MGEKIKYFKSYDDKPVLAGAIRPGDKIISEAIDENAGPPAHVKELNEATAKLWEKQRREANRKDDSDTPEDRIIKVEIGIDNKNKVKIFLEILLKIGGIIIKKDRSWKVEYAIKSGEIASSPLKDTLVGYSNLDDKEKEIFNEIMSDNGLVKTLEEEFGLGSAQDIIKKAIRVNRDTRISSRIVQYVIQ